MTSTSINYKMCFAFTTALLLATNTFVAAIESIGFTEPYREIQVASDEVGTIEEVLVREGHAVKTGQPLVRLNSVLFKAQLAIAKQYMESRGRLEAAVIDMQMRRDRLEKIKSLHKEGHARQEEVDIAEAESATAEANVRSVEEDLEIRRLEYEKIRKQISRRTILAPIHGTITTLHKEKGEFVAANSPDVVTLVQVDKLLAIFTLSGSQAEELKVDQKLKIQFINGNKKTTGKIEFISPINDAESKLVLVKIRIDNSDAKFRSGERCKIDVGK